MHHDGQCSENSRTAQSLPAPLDKGPAGPQSHPTAHTRAKERLECAQVELTSELASPKSPLLATGGTVEQAAGWGAALSARERATAASTAWKWDTAWPATVSRLSPSLSTLLAFDPARQLRTRSTCTGEEPRSWLGFHSPCAQKTAAVDLGVNTQQFCAFILRPDKVSRGRAW